MEKQEKKLYLTIGSIRTLDIRVIDENNEILYDGMVENAPEYIKQLKYFDAKKDEKMFFYVWDLKIVSLKIKHEYLTKIDN